jgi:cysteine desulfurase
MRRVYLDHNASSPLRKSALAQLGEWSTEPLGANPSSAHRDGRLARRTLEDARERLSRLVDCEPEELVFTSGGTEANAWALLGWSCVAVLPIEHPSVLAAAGRCTDVRMLPLTAAHQLDLDSASPLLERCELASIGLANHETGLLQRVGDIARRHPDRRWLLHTDASQALGRIPVSFRDLGVDLMTLSAHKLGGPPGIGALVIREGVERPPLIVGGPQEGSRRAGTEAVLLAALFASAAEEAATCHEQELVAWEHWTQRLRTEIPRLDPSSIFISSDVDHLPNTVSVAFPGRPGPSLVHRLDLEGVSVSHGSACASGSLEPSPVLAAMGYRDEVSGCSLRISFGHGHATDDVDLFLSRLGSTLDAVQARVESQKKSAGSEQ